MISIPTSVAVTQWVLLLGLAMLVAVMYRQLGYLLRLQSVGTARDGLATGSRAPGFRFHAYDGPETLRRFDPLGKWTLLVFADPGCSSCETAVDVLGGLDLSGLPELQLAVVTSMEPSDMPVTSHFRSCAIPILHVAREVPVKLYQSNSVPLAILVDPGGLVRDKDIPINRDRVMKLLRQVKGAPMADKQELEVLSQ